MTPFTAAALLGAWDRGQSLRPAERAVSLLSVASGADVQEELLRLPLDERDRRLAALYVAQFGALLPARVDCPACSLELELALDASKAWSPPNQDRPAVLIQIDGHAVRVRLPNTDDLRAIEDLNDPDAARLTIIRRCLLEEPADVAGPLGQGSAAGLATVPSADLLERVAQALSEAAGDADITLDVNCPACGTRWQADVDIGEMLWLHIAQAARRVLVEVHTLARAYGWSEAEVLSLSAQRRRDYLALVGA